MSNECAGEWSRKHLRDNFTYSFISNELREHQKNILVETQLSLMPETQLVVEEMDRCERINAKIHILNQIRSKKQFQIEYYEDITMGEYTNKKNAIADMGSWHTNYYGNQFITQIKHAIDVYDRNDAVIPDDGLLDTMQTILHNYNNISEQLKANAITIELNKKAEWNEYLEQGILEINNLDDQIKQLVNKRDAGHTKQRAEFIKKCGDPECRGFISTRWKCGLCNKHTCIDCHEIKRDEVPHVCDENVVKTIKLLKTDTKNCPKCQTSIYKVNGCEQMWCTQCKTGFSWRTGQIETKIHNPHYYEWRRQNDGTYVGADNQCSTPSDIFIDINAADIDEDLKTELLEKCRWCIHNDAHNTDPQIPNFENYRIQYMKRQINIEEFKSSLIRSNKAYLKKHELYTVYELLSTTFTEIMRRFCMDFRNTTILRELDTIIEYVNGCFADIAYSYGSITKHMVDSDMRVYKIRV
jgi:hypothetical protein